LTFKQLRALIASVLENSRKPVASESTNPESEEVAAAAARLEAALERIAQQAAKRPPEEGGENPRVAEVVSRLEALIATLRSALGRPR
jgi:uncharacterized membrane protein